MRMADGYMVPMRMFEREGGGYSLAYSISYHEALLESNVPIVLQSSGSVSMKNCEHFPTLPSFKKCYSTDARASDSPYQCSIGSSQTRSYRGRLYLSLDASVVEPSPPEASVG